MVRSRTSCWPRARSASAKASWTCAICADWRGLVERVLERPLVDGEQHIALLDVLAVLEMHLVEIAGHARAYLDRIDRDEAADIFVLVDDGARNRLGDRHRAAAAQLAASAPRRNRQAQRPKPPRGEPRHGRRRTGSCRAWKGAEGGAALFLIYTDRLGKRQSWPSPILSWRRSAGQRLVGHRIGLPGAVNLKFLNERATI